MTKNAKCMITIKIIANYNVDIDINESNDLVFCPNLIILLDAPMNGE